MSLFIPGKPSVKRRRAAMQAALYHARKRRIDLVTGGDDGGEPEPIDYGAQWDPSSIVGSMTVSEDGFTVSTTDEGQHNAIRCATGHATGSHYIEFQDVLLNEGLTFVGLGKASSVPQNGGAVDGIICLTQDETVCNGQQFSLVLSPAIETAKTVSFAINRALGKIWVRENLRAWNVGLGGTQDPATGQGGISLDASVTGTLFPMCRLRKTTDLVRARLATVHFLNPVPAGYDPWGE